MKLENIAVAALNDRNVRTGRSGICAVTLGNGDKLACVVYSDTYWYHTPKDARREHRVTAQTAKDLLEQHGVAQ